MINIPPGYTLLEPQSGLRLLVRQDLEQLVQRLGLASFPAAPRPAADGPGPAGGRSSTRRVELGDDRRLVVKIYRRGGLLGRIRGDSYSGISRQLQEIRVCEAARSAGIRVPLIQCLWMQQSGPLRHRLAAATMEIPGARDLFSAYKGCRHDPEQCLLLLAATADEVRKLHDAGIRHPDLNLGNILVTCTNGTPEIHLIDFDRATLIGRPLNTGERYSALSRMYRSLAKLSRPKPPPLSNEEQEHFLSRYWNDASGSHTALRRRCRRELALHRLWWRLNPPRARG